MLAIVIPYYKRVFFEQTLQSLANQSDKRFKVYIGDDASPENPKELLDKYKDKFNFKYQRFNENLGGTQLVKQWERCIDLSKNEEWFLVLGDDDVFGKNCIEEFYNCLPEIIEEKCKVVRFATVIIDGMNNQKSSLHKHPKLEKAADFYYKRFTNKTRSSLSEYIFKRSAYKKFGFYNYDLGWFADDRAWLEFSEFKNIYSINTAFVSFRLSDENISRENYKLEEKEKVRLQFFRFLISKHITEFKQSQQRHLLMYYEQLIYKNKKVTFSFWFLILFWFFKRYDFIEGIKFTRRIFIHLNKNE
mgnify:CR=1 FL=1